MTRELYTECQIDGCSRKHYALSYCRIHYGRFKRAGSPLELNYNPVNKGSSLPCRIDSCFNVSRSLLLCERHYQQHRKGKLKEELE